MIEKFRFTKNGKKIKVFEFNSKLHEKIFLEENQFCNHISKKHPEITLESIKMTLDDPDIISKQSRSKKEHFYQKFIETNILFIVVAANHNVKNIRFVLTAYLVNDYKYLKDKNIHIVYKK